MNTALVVRQDTGEALPVAAPFDMGTYLADLKNDRHLAQQKALAALYDAACAALIGPNDVQVEGKRSFKKKSAWRKLARHFGISTEVVEVEKEDLNGTFCATVTVRGVAPWGQLAEEVGACATDEATGRREISIADAIATAATRATNRAISNLIAMGEVSAEEINERKPYGERESRRPGAAAAPARAEAKALTLADALAMPFPFQKGKPQHGKAMGELETEMLQNVAAWIHEKQGEKGDEEWHADTVAAIGLILGDREKSQTKLPLEGERTEPVAVQEPVPVAADGRTIDDDLPF